MGVRAVATGEIKELKPIPQEYPVVSAPNMARYDFAPSTLTLTRRVDPTSESGTNLDRERRRDVYSSSSEDNGSEGSSDNLVSGNLSLRGPYNSGNVNSGTTLYRANGQSYKIGNSSCGNNVNVAA